MDERLKAFYEGRLIPLAELAVKNGVEFFPVRPEASGESYYTDHRSNDTYLHQIDLTDLKTEMEKLWSNDEFSEVAALAGELEGLAFALKEKEEPADEISPFIYAMF